MSSFPEQHETSNIPPSSHSPIEPRPSMAAPEGRRLHPLIATAAGAVIVASLVGVAAVTGLFSHASGSNATTAQQQAGMVGAPPALGQPAMLSQQTPAAAPVAPAQTNVAPTYAQGYGPGYGSNGGPGSAPAYAPTNPAHPAPAICTNCGTVQSVVALRHRAPTTGVGAVGGAVVGGLVGNQFGGGLGRAGMTVLGAVGGGVAGNSVEGHLRSMTDYQVRVRLQDGHYRTFTYRNPPPFRDGEPVRIEGGTLVNG